MVNFFVSRAFLIGVPVALTIYYLLPTARLQVPLLIVTSLVIFWFAAGNHSEDRLAGSDKDLGVRWSCSPDATERVSTLALVKAGDRLSLSCAS